MSLSIPTKTLVTQKRLVAALILTLSVGSIAGTVLLFLSQRRAAPPIYDFLARLSECEIQDRGFLSLCWREPLKEGWSSSSEPDGRISWRRRLEMPLDSDPQMIELFREKGSRAKRLLPEGSKGLSWSVRYGINTRLGFKFDPDSNGWSAVNEFIEPDKRAVLWLDIRPGTESSGLLSLTVMVNDEQFQRFEALPGVPQQVQWPVVLPERHARVSLFLTTAERGRSLANLFVRGGLVYPSHIQVFVSARQKDFSPEELVLYYRPKDFDILLPDRSYLSQLPATIVPPREWMTTRASVNHISRPALRLLPGQSLRFPVQLSREPELRLTWTAQLANPVPDANAWRDSPAGNVSTRLQLAITADSAPDHRSEPSKVVWETPVQTDGRHSSSSWQGTTVSLLPWDSKRVIVELSFLGDPPLEPWSPLARDGFDFPFAYVSLEPLLVRGYLDREHPSIILIGHDTLRADRLSCYGYRHPTTPNLDRLAEHGTRYERAYSAASFTLPSFASLLTSRYPSEHTAYSYYLRLPESVPTVTRILKQAGYQTAAVASAAYLSPFYGLDQGFDYFDYRGGNIQQILARALQWLDGRDRKRPFFLFLHYYDTHAPYFSPEEFRYRFHPNPAYNRMPEIKTQVSPKLVDYPENWPKFQPEDIEHINALYDGSIHWVDFNLAAFISGLTLRGLYTPTLIVFTSDHGEFFGEKGRFSHGNVLHEKLLHVPLLVKWPRNEHAGQVVQTPVSLLDLAPTLLDVAGLAIPKSWQGRSLLSLQAARNPENRPLFAELPEQKKVAVIEYPYKLSVSTTQHDPFIELYHLEADPTELNNLADQQPERTSNLLQQINRHLSRTHPLTVSLRQKTEMTPEVLEQLEALGYLHK